MSRFQSRSGASLHWRVIVGTAGVGDPSRTSRPLAWHLTECADPSGGSSHCAQGQQMLNAGGDPDGHCLIDGECPRCAMASSADAPVLATQ
jgi:hypothetical protein